MSQDKQNESAVVTLAAPDNGHKLTENRFDVFAIDIGWNSPISENFRKNIRLALRYQKNCNCYVLSSEQCFALSRIHPSLLGVEPSLVVIDRIAMKSGRRNGFGFKLNLGLVRNIDAANNMLKWILAVLAEQDPKDDITDPIRKLIHKEGIRGALDIITELALSTAGGHH